MCPQNMYSMLSQINRFVHRASCTCSRFNYIANESPFSTVLQKNTVKKKKKSDILDSKQHFFNLILFIYLFLPKVTSLSEQPYLKVKWDLKMQHMLSIYTTYAQPNEFFISLLFYQYGIKY